MLGRLWLFLIVNDQHFCYACRADPESKVLPSGVTAVTMRIAYKAPPPTPGAERPTEWCAAL